MFDTIGWGEIFVVILAGLIIIGPERLPGVIMDVRAAIFAARRAINNAKEELYGEEFDEFRKPMSTVTEYAAMGPKRAIAKVLFDEDGDYSHLANFPVHDSHVLLIGNDDVVAVEGNLDELRALLARALRTVDQAITDAASH